MIRRNTWILLILLLALVGASFYLRSRKARQEASATPTGAASVSQPLFPSSYGTPDDISVKDTTGKVVEIGRNAGGAWVLKAPTQADADQAAAQAAASQVMALQVLSGVNLGLDVVGLNTPSYTMTFKFPDGKSHTLAVGAETPIQDGYYTSLDGGPVRIVDKQGIEALIQLLTQPPYAVTPTPLATETTVAPTATIEPSITPTAAGTATPPTATATP